MRLCLRPGEDRYPLPHWKDPRYLRGAYIMNHKKLLLTLTLCLCALLCMVVTASASEVSVHSHLICKGTTCTDPAHSEGNHGSVTFATELRQDGNTLYIGDQVWTYEHNVGYILPAGTYYLGTDLTLDHRIQISDSNGGSVVLCLNGKTISCTTGKTIQIKSMNSKDLTFTLCDCKGGGMITHAEDSGNGSGVDVAYSGNINNTDVAKFIMYNGCITQNKGSGVYLNANTAFTMYGGSITQNGYNDTSIFGGYGGGVYVASEASFTMYGGNITGNYADTNGGGVHVGSETANFTMYGGSITGNHTAGSGGGVNVNAGTMIVRGDINISGNWKGTEQSSASNDNANNVYLSAYDSSSKFATITIEKALTGKNSSIGVTTATPVATTKDASVKIAAGEGTYAITDADKDHFTPDTGYCEVQKKDDGALYLTHVHSGGEATCTAAAKCGGCSQPYGNTNPNNHALVHHEAQAPTCTAVGWEAYDTCSRCGYSTTKVEIPMAAHTYSATEWESDVDNHWHKCAVCNTQIDKAAHEWQPATYTAPKTCVCGATQGEPLTRSYYYYAPSAAENKKDSPKTADPGVLLYAGLALASLTGLACTAKKRH